MTSRKSGFTFTIVALLLAATSLGLAQDPQPAAIVSAASFYETVSPNSLASVFGTGFAEGTFEAEFDQSGALPTALGGVSVEIDGQLARLIFVSSTQINLVIPEGVDLGMADVRVFRAGEEKGEAPAEGSTLSADVRLTAPGIFAIRCLRGDQAAVLNGVTFRTGPFRTITPENPIEDKRTRLAIFATGIRYAGNLNRKGVGSTIESLTLEGTDIAGNVFPIELEYAGPASGFEGLDQINAVLEPELDGIGLMWLRLSDGEQISNAASIVLSPDGLGDLSLVPEYQIGTVAGMGEAGYSGDGGAAVAARLRTPLTVAVDRFLNLFIADSDNGVVRRVDAAAGTIATVAGTVGKGASGDGGLATDAQLLKPTAVAVDFLGNFFIADAGEHRARRVDLMGVITTVAGTGVSGYGGDGGRATVAQLSSPAAVAINPQGSLIIADTGNHRLRMVTGDGRIQTIVGTGEAGFSGDNGAAVDAQINAPDSIAIGRDSTLFFADTGNGRIRRIDAGGTISSSVGGPDASKGAADVPSSIVIPEGETQGTFEVGTFPVAEDTVAMISATSANSVNDTLTIKAPCVDTLTLTVDSVLGGGSVTGTVTLA